MALCSLAMVLMMSLVCVALAMRSPCAGSSCALRQAALTEGLSADEGISLLQVSAKKTKANSSTTRKPRFSDSDVRKRRPRKDARIVIIGAGPAGIHMAMELKKLGYANVTVLEKSDRIGGKSFTLYRDAAGQPCEQPVDPITGVAKTSECIAHEMGVVSHLHNSHHTVRSLIEEYGLSPEVVPPERTIFSELAPCHGCGLKMSDLVEAAIVRDVNAGKIKVPDWVPNRTSFVAAYALIDAAARYNTLSRDTFGDVEFTLPERMSFEQLDRIDMSFKQLLDKHRLTALEELLKLTHTAHGYGYLGSVHAFYGLMWVTPEVINGLVQQMLHEVRQQWTGSRESSETMKYLIHKMAGSLVGGNAHGVEHTTTMLPDGFQKLWSRIAERDGLNVKLNAEIENFGIDRQLYGDSYPIRIAYSLPGENKGREEDFDELIYSAPLNHAFWSLLDITDDERALFDDLKQSSLVTTLYTSDSPRAGSMYDARLLQDKSGEGHMFGDRNDNQIFGSTPTDGELHVAVQFYESACTLDKEICHRRREPNASGFGHEVAAAAATLEEDLKSRGATNVDIVQQFAWPFFPRFSRKGIRQGYMWDIFDMQGMHKTWWLGAGATFDSVHDIVNYNNMLLKRYFGSQVTGDGARRKSAKGVSLV